MSMGDNDWGLFEEIKETGSPYYQDIDASVAAEIKCPVCGEFMSYAGFGRPENVAYFDGVPISTMRYSHAFALCEKDKYAINF